MNWAFVDYENVRSLESVNLGAYQRVLVFCGPQNKSIKFDALPASGVCHVDLITVPTSSKNNVDFHLAFHMGIEHQRAAGDINFHVISNDKGYQGLINHLELLGRSCKLVEPNASKVAPVKKAPVKKAAGKKATDKTKSVEAKAEVASKTKPAAKAATASAAKPSRKATTKANKTTPSLSASADKLFTELKATATNRPKTKTRVMGWIEDRFKKLHLPPEPTPADIFREWQKSGVLTVTGSAVSYSDK